MQNFRALGAPPPDPRTSGCWGLCPQTPGTWGLLPRPHWLPAAGGSAPTHSLHHSEFLATRLITPNKEIEIYRRIALGWQGFGRANSVLTCKPPILSLKHKVYNQCILSVMTYGSET